MNIKTVRTGLILLAIFHAANGLYMLAAPDQWYMSVPGVPATGPMNHHFIMDIGLAFLVSAAGLALGSRPGSKAAAFAVAGAAFPTLHAVMHVCLWFVHGFPQGTQLMFSEYIAVAGASFLGAALAWLRYKEGDA
ncbi:MAG TPA: hypothetical protein VGM36_15105 [Rhizomicrobium sp.]|jgi:hypothetical protein